MTIPHSNDFNFYTNDFTIECWIYLLNSTCSLFSKSISGGINGSSYNLYIEQNYLYFAFSNGTSWIYNEKTTEQLSLNQWYHIAVVRNRFLNSLSSDNIRANENPTAPLSPP